MNKTLLTALCLSGTLTVCNVSLAANGVDTTVPSPDSSGPTNPTPPTLPTPGTGAEDGVGTGIDGPDSAPTPGTDGTGREEKPGSVPEAAPANPGDHRSSSGDNSSGNGG